MPRRIVIRDLAGTAISAAELTKRHCLVRRCAQQSRHCALTGRYSRLHGITANAQNARGIRKLDRAASGQCGILTERVSCHERGLVRADAMGLKRTDGSNADGHERRLRIRRQLQLFLIAFPDQLRKILMERGVHRLEDFPRFWICRGKVLAHADELAALSGENERELGHAVLPFSLISGI